MTEKKISEKLRHCLEGKGCDKCSNNQPESRMTCPVLNQKKMISCIIKNQIAMMETLKHSLPYEHIAIHWDEYKKQAKGQDSSQQKYFIGSMRFTA